MRNPSDALRIPEAVNATPCSRHNAGIGDPCWNIPKDIKGAEGYYAAICGRRIKAHGFNGKIDPASVRTKQPVARKFPRKTASR